MGKSSLYGEWGRYSSIAPTLVDGASGALQVNASGALKVSRTKPVGLGNSSQKMKYGEPGRYHSGALTLQDGDEVALLINTNGTLIIT